MDSIAVEVTRNNVSLSAFFSAIKKACETKGISLDLDRDLFENPPGGGSDVRYSVKDGKRIAYYDGFKVETDASDAPCESEICRFKPLDYQTYVKNFDGMFYNEICEFTFWDDKRGSGYYYRASKQMPNQDTHHTG
jgi:hypothetical protein